MQAYYGARQWKKERCSAARVQVQIAGKSPQGKGRSLDWITEHVALGNFLDARAAGLAR